MLFFTISGGGGTIFQPDIEAFNPGGNGGGEKLAIGYGGPSPLALVGTGGGGAKAGRGGAI